MFTTNKDMFPYIKEKYPGFAVFDVERKRRSLVFSGFCEFEYAIPDKIQNTGTLKNMTNTETHVITINKYTDLSISGKNAAYINFSLNSIEDNVEYYIKMLRLQEMTKIQLKTDILSYVKYYMKKDMRCFYLIAEF